MNSEHRGVRPTGRENGALKLLFINSSLTDGGSEKAMTLVAQELARRNHDVTMSLVRDKERTYDTGERIDTVQFTYGDQGKLRKLLARVRKIRRQIKSNDYDFVICYMWDLNLTTLVAALGISAKIVVSERAFPGTSTRGRLSRLLERVLYRRAHRIVYQTEMAREYCPRELVERSAVVPNMVPQSATSQHSGPRAQRVVSIGRLGPQKNFPLLLRSFAEFLQSDPGWTLEIYGKGELEASLRTLARDLGIAHAVSFEGYVQDLSSRIKSAGMFVLASDFEGISNAMTEAMALGIPTVCTDCPVGGAALVIEDGVSGRLVPVGDQPELVKAMRQVSDDESFANTLSEGARESVRNFSPQRLGEVWEDRVLC